MRPILEGRIPVIGRHPEKPNFTIINGLASKGTAYAPFCSKLLLDQLENDVTIPDEINVHERFYA